MMPFLARTLKRLATLVFGATVIYLAVWRVFPFFDNRTPAYVALLLTYIAMAYLITPLLLRVYRFFYHPMHLPLYCITPDGFASDPINIALIGTREQVLQAMQAAGWKLADGRSLPNIIRQVFSAFSGQAYPNAPMSNLYLFGRKQDMSFELEINGRSGQRHHVRFWAANLELTGDMQHHMRFWRRFYRPQRHSPDTHLWVGAASKDAGFAPIRHNAQVTHMIDPNTNAERTLLVQNLRDAGALKNNRLVKVNRPFSLRNRAFRGYLKSDGQIAICKLR